MTRLRIEADCRLSPPLRYRRETINSRQLMYRTALEVDDGRLKYGCVYVYTPRIEDDIEKLDLTLVVDTNDWDAISAWMREVIGGIIEWEAGLSDAQIKDARTRIQFGCLPAIYDHETA